MSAAFKALLTLHPFSLLTASHSFRSPNVSNQPLLCIYYNISYKTHLPLHFNSLLKLHSACLCGLQLPRRCWGRSPYGSERRSWRKLSPKLLVVPLKIGRAKKKLCIFPTSVIFRGELTPKKSKILIVGRFWIPKRKTFEFWNPMLCKKFPEEISMQLFLLWKLGTLIDGNGKWRPFSMGCLPLIPVGGS